MAKGTVVVTRGDRQTRLEAKERFVLRDGDRLETLADTKAEIKTATEAYGSGIVIQQNTRLTVNEVAPRRPRSVIILVAGAMRALVQKWAGGNPYLETPTAVVRIKGTDFVVSQIDADSGEIIGLGGVVEGISRAEPDNPDYRVEIGRRQMTRVVEGQAPTPPAYVPDEIWFRVLQEFSFAGEKVAQLPPAPHSLINETVSAEASRRRLLSRPTTITGPAPHPLVKPAPDEAVQSHPLLR